eukprot:TRINITY_DN7567_c0_g1_i2.p1 TRINITY_DN7567_c0_g1~~TRINITY_DN7567_c0_g1_i2.p1  ORF type:complete len:701 (+),score=200.47 TRINITY_DN7567_c0_g1_i2:56-2158(+)
MFNNNNKISFYWVVIFADRFKNPVPLEAIHRPARLRVWASCRIAVPFAAACFLFFPSIFSKMRLVLQNVTNNGRRLLAQYHRGFPHSAFERKEFVFIHSSRKCLKSPGSTANLRSGFASNSGNPGFVPPRKSEDAKKSATGIWLGSAAAVALLTSFYVMWDGKIGGPGTIKDKKGQLLTVNEDTLNNVKYQENGSDGSLKYNSFGTKIDDMHTGQPKESNAAGNTGDSMKPNETIETGTRHDKSSLASNETNKNVRKAHEENEVNSSGENTLNSSHENEFSMNEKPSSDDRMDNFEVPAHSSRADGPAEISGEKENEMRDFNHENAPKTAAIDGNTIQEENEENEVQFKISNQAAQEATEEINPNNVSSKGEVVLSLIEAIHAAEKRQAEEDARIYEEYKQKLKAKYENELKDARARELMYVEEIDTLEKELNKEKEKAAASIKAFQEKAEERLKSELKMKEDESEKKLRQAQLLGEAEKAAAIAKEKSTHLNEMADTNIQVNALRMAFFTRSEEARQSHSLHNLAMGTFALEDALLMGEPLNREIEVLHASVEENDKDGLIDVVLSTLPSEVLEHGAKTKAQLHQKFESLKGALRELALIPAAGGGVLTHALARFISVIKVKEDGYYHEGFESTIARVENFLAAGNLVEAANTLEEGAKGSKAEALAADWARQARVRAVTEQALELLHAYSMTIASSLV